MRTFVLGIVATLVVLAVTGFGAVKFGLVPANADSPPSGLERWAAHTSLHATIARDAGTLQPPAAVGNAELATGVKLYAANCAFCHGAADAKPSISAQGFYIEAPQLAKDGVEDDPEAVTFWKLKHGIRFTAMPAFGGRLGDDQLWAISAFLKEMDALPPPIAAAWKHVPSAEAAPAPAAAHAVSLAR